MDSFTIQSKQASWVDVETQKRLQYTPMTAITVEQDNRSAVLELLESNSWVIACLCAAWCDVCKAYRPGFDELAGQQPDKSFLWIDIEDQADLVGDLEIENFPTLLIQRGEQVAFFGPVQPDIGIVKRLVSAYTQKTKTELEAEVAGSTERQGWQEDCNLHRRLQQV